MTLLLSDAINILILAALWWFMYGWVRSAHAGAPFVPTRSSYTRRLLAMADLKPSDILYDLGCGDGRVVISAVRDFGIKRAVGIDISPLPLTIARLRLALSGLGNRVMLRRDNILTVELEPATVIFTYLMPR
jgi:methylase of polypeptide subunit release factors